MMLKRITYIAPHKTAITMSIVFGVVSLLFVIPMAFTYSFMPMQDQGGNPVDTPFPFFMILVMPIFYFLASYIVIGLSAWLYNKVVKFTGGIAYEAAE